MKTMIEKYKKKFLELAFFIIPSRQLKFNLINTLNYWGDNESKSGLGSNNANTENLKRELLQFIVNQNIEQMLDIPCGDFVWMSRLIENIENKNFVYVGADIATRVINRNKIKFKENPNASFQVLDLCKDPLPNAELLFVRDCLFHLSNSDIKAALKNIRRSNCKFVAVSAHNVPSDYPNKNIKTGFFRKINVKTSPFNITAQPKLILDDSSEAEPHKIILIFKHEDI
jgi:SAM-dependent methyltransferase